jgi:hypothetical protein
MKALGPEVQFHVLLISAVDTDWWSARHPDYFNSEERAPGTYWVGGWVDLRASLDTTVKTEISAHAGNQTPISQLSSP